MEIFMMALRAVIEVFFLALGVAVGFWGYDRFLSHVNVSASIEGVGGA